MRYNHNFHLFIIALIALCIAAASCSESKNRNTEWRASKIEQKFDYSRNVFYWGATGETNIIQLDSAYQPNDTVHAYGFHYVLIGKADSMNQQRMISQRDYQFDIYDDSTVIYDGDRHVGTLPFDEKQRLDSLMMVDNL